MALTNRILNVTSLVRYSSQNYLHTSAILGSISSGRYKPTLKRTKALTYEMAYRPFDIAHKKSWNSWNTSNVKDGNRPSETVVEDIFIRKFIRGTWHNLVLSEIIIKRQHNIIRIAMILKRGLSPTKMYFLTGYTQEMLGSWIQCPVKLELVTLENNKDIIFKYI